jgi:hypothetical protein
MNPKNKLPPKPIDLNKAFVLAKNKIYNNPVFINNKTIINLPNIINKNNVPKNSNSSISFTPILNNKRRSFGLSISIFISYLSTFYIVLN